MDHVKIKSHFQLCYNIVSVLCSGFLASRLSYCTRDQTHTCYTGCSSPNLWTTRKAPELGLEFWFYPHALGWVTCSFVSETEITERGFSTTEVCSPNPLFIKGKCTLYYRWSYYRWSYRQVIVMEYMSYTHVCVWDFSKIIMKEEINQLCACFWSKQILEILLGMKGKISCYCQCFQKGDFSVPALWDIPVSTAEGARLISPMRRSSPVSSS